MGYRNYLGAILAMALHVSLCAQSVNDAFSALAIHSQISESSEVNKRLADSYHWHILSQDVDHLILPFENRTETRLWQSEFWGKWFTSAVLAYRYHPTDELQAKLKYAVEALLNTQSDDGYIGNYAESHRLQQWDIWGRKYAMLGLLAYHELTSDGRSLQAARKVADHLMAELAGQGGVIVTKGNYRGMAASSVLEPICLLYNQTKERRYLDFAEEIVRQWETSEGPGLIGKAGVDVASRFPKPETGWYSWEQGQKAYEMMSCYEGLLELHRITGKPEYRDAVERAWANIRDTEINLAGSGASAEMWFGGRERQARPVFHYQETCVTVTWIKLSHQLLRLTGEAKYADAAERAFYNALLGSLSPTDYRWAKYTPLMGQRLPGSGQCGMDLNCCEASGPRGLFNVPSHIVMRNDEGVSVNYYVPGEYGVELEESAKVKLVQETTYPEGSAVTVRVGVADSKSFTLSLRIPAWSVRTSVTVNGTAVPVDTAMGYLRLERVWKDGDRIELDLDMRGRVETLDQHFAIFRGPILLARDGQLGEPPLTNTIRPVLDDDGFIPLQPATHKPHHKWLVFTAQFTPESYTEYGAEPISVALCDYATAGYGDKGSAYRVWMPVLQDPR